MMLYTYLIGIIPALFFYIYMDNKVHKDDKGFTGSEIIVFCAIIWPVMLILQLFFILVDITEKLRK